MSFLGPLISILGGTLIPKAVSWIGKKVMGSPIGNIASHISKNDPYLVKAG